MYFICLWFECQQENDVATLCTQQRAEYRKTKPKAKTVC